MSFVLYDQGKKLGEVSDWVVIQQVPVYKNVLGKTVLSVPSKEQCTFISPKPVNRKSKLTVLENSKTEYVLELKSVTGGTAVTAVILEKNKI